MPNIKIHASTPPTIDCWRRNPGQLLFSCDLAAAGIVRSYDALSRALKNRTLPEPYRLPGGRLAWEARDILSVIGAASAMRTEASVEQQPRSVSTDTYRPMRSGDAGMPAVNRSRNMQR
jgi:hypothetical protein